MSAIRDKFYNIFWQNKSCQNTFLLSKNELLDTIDFSTLNSPFSYSTNRIIISNSDHEKESKDVIKLRTENYNFDLEASLDEKILYFEPIVKNFLNSKYKKQFDKFMDDFEKQPFKFLPILLKLLNEDSNKEKLIITLLKQYHFLPSSVNSFKEVQQHFEDMLIPSKKSELINERNVKLFSEGLKFVKELYVNHNYKRLYASNQILVNSLVESDNFTDRIDMFRRLFDAKILLPSSDDGIIECHHCDPLTYRGSIQLRLNPKKLEKLTCPSCTKPLTYFVPYILDQEIFKIVQSQDGLILDASSYLLDQQKIKHSLNEKRLTDIEIDCMFHFKKSLFLVEAKMYELRTGPRKLSSKIKTHFSALSEDVTELKKTDEFAPYRLKPVLLVNIDDTDLLSKIEFELKSKHDDEISQSIAIMNIHQFKNILTTQ